MKKQLSLFIIFIFLYNVTFSQSISIGTGSFTNGESPWDPYYGYSYVQTIYKSSEIVASGNITSISFYYAGNSLSGSDSIVVYMGNTTKNEFASTNDWVPLSELSVVFNGKIQTPTLPGQVTITLDAPFAYNGIDNLVIGVDENKDGFDGAIRFNSTIDATGSNRVLFYKNDNINPNPINPPPGNLSILFGNIVIYGLTQANCQVVTNVTVDNLTATIAQGIWQAPTTGTLPINYEWEMRTNGAAGSGSIGLAASGNSTLTNASITGLISQSQYNFYVRAECSTGVFGPWSVTYPFYFCGATNTPYLMDFNNGLGLCSKIVNVANGNTWTIDPNLKLVLKWDLNKDSKAWFFTQGIQLTKGISYRLDFQIGTEFNYPYESNLNVYYGATQSANSNKELITSFPLFWSLNPKNSSTDFIPDSTGVYYFGFYGYQFADENGLILDNISLNASPPCGKPTGITKSNITTSSVNLSWNVPSTGTPSFYELYYSTVKPELKFKTEPKKYNISDTTTALTLLLPNTKYYYTIRSACGTTLRSDWTEIDSFTTAPCYNIVAPTIAPETFSSGVIPPECWREEEGKLKNSTILYNNGFGNWEVGNFINSATTQNKCAKIKISAAVNYDYDWLFTPTYNIGANGNYQLEFDLGLTKINQTSSTTLGWDDKFYVVVSTDNGASWDSANTIRKWNAYTPISNNGEHITIPLSGYTGLIKIGFYSEANYYNDTSELFIDNVEVKPLQTVPVMLTNLTGDKKNKINHLFWSTASEVNNKGFEIQRSFDGIHFYPIGYNSSISTNGNSVSVLNYQFLDEKTPSGMAYYRLKQINLDGSFIFSKVVMIKGIENTSDIAIITSYPNPVRDKLNVVLSSTVSENITLIVCDLAGKVFFKKSANITLGNNQVELNVKTLEAGSYIIKFICPNGCKKNVQKFVKL